MRSSRADLVLTALLSILAHYALFTIIPRLPRPRAERGSQPVEIELQFGPTAQPPPPLPEVPAVSLPPVAEPEPRSLPHPLPQLRPREVRREQQPPEPRERVLVKTVPEKQHRILQSVDQPHESDEPTPEDPHFISQSNRNVREETVARARSLTDNDPNPQGSRPNESREAEAGTDDEEQARETRDRPGVRERDSANASTKAPRLAQVPRPGGDERPRAPRIASAAQTPRRMRDGTTPDSETGMGVQTPERQQGHDGREGRQGGRGQDRGPELRLSWSQFTELYGEGELARQRQELAELRRTRVKGRFVGNWERIRAAIENYVPDVRPGNQTALRSARSPFAVYLTQVHRRLHRLWAEGFLVDLVAHGDDSPLNDFTLIVNLEIVINSDGSLHKVGVVDGGSGNLVFDAAAVDVVYRSAPHPSPPHEIVSGDGRTYLHWAFYRNHRQCGTFNAEPFIIPNPPSMPRDEGIEADPADPVSPLPGPELREEPPLDDDERSPPVPIPLDGTLG